MNENIVPRLLEFFEKEELHNLFHIFEEQNLDPVEQFYRLEEAVIEYVKTFNRFPSLLEAMIKLNNEIPAHS